MEEGDEASGTRMEAGDESGTRRGSTPAHEDDEISGAGRGSTMEVIPAAEARLTQMEEGDGSGTRRDPEDGTTADSMEEGDESGTRRDPEDGTTADSTATRGSTTAQERHPEDGTTADSTATRGSTTSPAGRRAVVTTQERDHGAAGRRDGQEELQEDDGTWQKGSSTSTTASETSRIGAALEKKHTPGPLPTPHPDGGTALY